MDLKIEIRKLAALHEATIRLEHAVRDVGQTEWNEFAPSRFVYAFFTFNSIYSFNWEDSFKERKAITWRSENEVHGLGEDEQFKAYVKYVDHVLSPETGSIFSEQLVSSLESCCIDNAIDELKGVNVTNATKKLKNLAIQLPGQFGHLLKGTARKHEFFPTACAVLEFVYRVRCNLFHGSKTHVQLLDQAQQRRLLIYSGILVATNSLLFKVTKKANIGWKDLKIDFHCPDQRSRHDQSLDQSR